ncbi:nuclear transport factor 2 family protein [Pseudoalteromonas porphyrae]|uniref:Transcriptional regulator n=1 Tax=Pseudoalteromonas porphyrae TaxID=187330 RepID=A0A0N1EN69_9GAMM|nr:nuclear transport factor 2 family protein [Pseudoalteromonas porphyrae]KPH62466.1 transcriptional regulator [Pseudoalteromonas porphyrae]
MREQKIENFVNIYQQLSKDSLHLLDDIYHPSICFSDPLHTVNGLDDLHSYFADLYSNVTECRFDISSFHSVDDNAFLYWTMYYRHPKLASHKEIAVQGHSHLVFDGNKIKLHRDYFDVGELLYQQIPFIGPVIKLINKRATQS